MNRFFKKYLVGLSLLLLVAVGCQKGAIVTKPLSLRLLHVNDHHAHLEAHTLRLLFDGEERQVQVGGFPALASYLKREEATFTFHAGDVFSGTLYYTLFKGDVDAQLMNLIPWTAFTLGNHEFDDGNSVLANFLKKLDAPVVSSNVKADSTSGLEGLWEEYLIVDVDGEKVAIIGLVVVDKTVGSSNPGPGVTFIDEVEAVRDVVKKVEKENINKIILVSHYGLENSIALASQVKGVDIIVDGDSHSLMGDFSSLGLTSQNDNYPLIVNSASQEPVVIVQAWEFSKAIGDLTVHFDKYGYIISAEGETILPVLEESIDPEERWFVEEHPNLASVVPDEEAMAALARYQDEKDELAKQKIGEATRDIVGGSAPRIPSEEYPQGSYAATLVAKAFYEKYNSSGTATADFAIQNSGGVRITIPKGDISIETVYTLLPFSNSLYQLQLTGDEVKQLLEEAIDYALSDSTGAFPYGWGIRFEAQKEGVLGERVVSVEVTDLKTGEWEPLNPEKLYSVITNDYIAQGKDGYLTFGRVNELRGGVNTYLDYAQSFADYVTENRTLYPPETTNVIFHY